MARTAPLPLAFAAAGFVAFAGFAAPALAQDAAAGQRVFAQCRACHVVENNGRNGVGPNLHGVTNRKAATIENFRYSASMREKAEAGLTWTDEASLKAYLANPKAVVPQGSMAFAGLRNPQQIEDVIAYLKTQGG